MLPAETLPKVLQLWSPFATFATVKSKVYLTTLEVSKHVHTIMYRCGKDLQKLFRLPSVQHFFNCLPPHKIYQEKDIYKPGILRKVHTAHTTQFMPSFINKTYLPLTKMQGKVLFHEATVSILETGEVTISTLQRSFSLQPDMSPDEFIHQHGAVVAYENEMVHTGDFVQVQTSMNDVSTFT